MNTDGTPLRGSVLDRVSMFEKGQDENEHQSRKRESVKSEKAFLLAADAPRKAVVKISRGNTSRESSQEPARRRSVSREVRNDVDGKQYTEEEFFAYYQDPAIWETAGKVGIKIEFEIINY